MYRILKVLKDGRKCLINDALNTFYLRLYGVRHLVKDHSDSERGNPLPPHGLHFSINKGSFICTIPQTVILHTIDKSETFHHPFKHMTSVEGIWEILSVDTTATRILHQC